MAAKNPKLERLKQRIQELKTLTLTSLSFISVIRIEFSVIRGDLKICPEPH
jgi:hypothetical protein